MTSGRAIAIRSALLIAVLSGVAPGQEPTPRRGGATFTIGTIGQQTRGSGYIWPGLELGGGVDIPLSGWVVLRPETTIAGFLAGADVQPSCVPGGQCVALATPSALFGATVSAVVGHPNVPLYAALGIGTWSAISDSHVGFEGGPTGAVGLRLPFASHAAIEARYDRPSSPIQLLTSTFSVSVRFMR